MTLDLHALANMPGAGKAQQALIKAGVWNPRADLPMRRWDVTLEVRVTVEARDADEAEKIATNDMDHGEVIDAVAEEARP